MAKGFIYVVATVNRAYEQPAFCDVPTWWKGRLYFGPCKRPMRPRMEPGDFVFGISPSGTSPRRVVFTAQLEERMTFAEAYERFPALRGPDGPIHVHPVSRAGPFPGSSYEHITGAMHADNWRADLARPELDRFFACDPAAKWQNTWLGAKGPAIDEEIAGFLRRCAAFGTAGHLADTSTGTVRNPIAHGNLYKGLHLETNEPETLMTLLGRRLGDTPRGPGASASQSSSPRGECGSGRRLARPRTRC